MASGVNRIFYHSKAWERVSKAYALEKHCICEQCGRPVYVAGVTDYLPKEKRLRYVVHHKKPITPNNINDFSVALDTNNLELLCHDCHQAHHLKKTTRSDVMFDENGQLIQRVTIKRNL